MVWTAQVVVVVVVVTLGYQGVPVSADDEDEYTTPPEEWSNVATTGKANYPSILTKYLSLKPNITITGITVLARDPYGYTGINVTFNAGQCFPLHFNSWYFSKIQVTKKSHMDFNFSLSVGVCEVSCTYYASDREQDVTMLTKVEVIPHGLLQLPHSCPDSGSDEDDYVPTEHLGKYNITDCTSSLISKCPQTASSSSTISTIPALPSTVQTTAPPPQILPITRSSDAQGSTTAPHKSLPAVAKVLVVTVVTQMLGTCVMAVVVFVVIRRSARQSGTIIGLSSGEEVSSEGNNFSDIQSPHSTSRGNHGQK